MSEEIQELHQVFSMDTSDAEAATARIVRHFGEVEKAEKRLAESSAANQKKAQEARKAAGGHGSGGHGGMGNMSMGVHDFLMGRGQAALSRFSSGLKVAGGYAVAVGVTLEAAGRAQEYVRGEVEKTNTAAERLEQSFLKVSKAATFSTVGEGTGKLNGTRDALLEQIQGERQQQGDLRNLQLLENQKFMGDPLGGDGMTLSAGGWYYKAKDRMASYFTGAPTTDEKMAASQMRERAAGQELAKINRQTTAAYGLDSDIARERSFRGNPFAAQRLELGRRQDVEIADAQSHGNGGEENLALIRQRYAIEKEGIDRAEAAANRQLDLEEAINRAKRTGGAVEVKTAKERMDAAGKALALELPWTRSGREKQQAFFAARDEYNLANRNQDIERAGSRIDLATAGFRGNSDDRAALSAQAEVDKARERLRILQETKGVKASEKELNDANLALVTAETNQELRRRQRAEARLALATTLRTAPGQVRAAGALLGGATDVDAERQGMRAQVDSAQAAFDAAKKRVEIEKGNEASLLAQAEAARELAQAQITAATFEQRTRRERALTMESMHGQTAALRFAASGRDDLGELAQQRAENSVAIKRANQEGNPEKAAELAEQQQLRERRSVQELYLNPDGTRKNPGEVQREIFQRQLRQTRFNQFNRAMDRTGGLVSVHRDMSGRIESGVDPLTGERLNARQIAEHNQALRAREAYHAANAKDDRSDREIQQDIFKLLSDRLPSTTAQ